MGSLVLVTIFVRRESQKFSNILVVRETQFGSSRGYKVTNRNGLWHTDLAWYSPSDTHWICRGREDDEPYWTVRCRARLILSECYSLDLPRSWRWRTTMDCDMLISPDTHRVILTGFAEVEKMTNHNGLWDADLTWYSPSDTHWICRGREDDEPQWTVRCWSHLILSEWYSLDLPRSRRWRTTMDCEMLISPDTLRVILTGFAEVEKMTNHNGLWDADLTWYSPSDTHWICRGREDDEPQWTVRCWFHLILSEWYSLDLPRSRRWRTTMDCEMLISPDTLRVLLTGFTCMSWSTAFGIYGFGPVTLSDRGSWNPNEISLIIW